MQHTVLPSREWELEIMTTAIAPHSKRPVNKLTRRYRIKAIKPKFIY